MADHPMKTEGDLHGGVVVVYKGKLYVTGNRRHDLVELYQGGILKEIVKISRVRLKTDEVA